MTQSHRTLTPHLIALVCGVVLTLVGGVFVTSQAQATFREVTETGAPGHLRLAVHEDTPVWSTVSPGQSATWLVRASLGDAEHSTLAVQIDSHGDLFDTADLIAELDTCSAAFDPATLGQAHEDVECAGLRTPVLAATPLGALAHDDAVYELAQLQRNDPREFLLTLTLPSNTARADVAGKTAHIGLGVHAAAVPAHSPITPAGLPHTGSALDLIAIGVFGAGLISLAIGVRGVQHHRRQRQGA